MTSSPDLIHELKASRPSAPVALRARVREIAAEEAQAPTRRSSRFRLPVRRISLVAFPAAAALAIAAAGVVGLARSDGDPTQATGGGAEKETLTFTRDQAESAPASGQLAPAQPDPTPLGADAVTPTSGRVQQVNATLTVEVADSDGVSTAAQEALALTRRLGGHVVTTTVLTGEEAGADLTVRVPVAKVQEAIVGLSALGSIVSQQVRIDDLQESVDAFERRQRSLRNQIAVVVARLEGSLDAETRARLEARLKNLRADYRGARLSEANVRAMGRMATIQLGVVTSDSGAAAPQSRLDRTLDEAVNVLVWEGVVVLAILIVVAPFAIVFLAAWLGRKLYRRREEDRLLAT
jgi:Domain of unknown function (DUF4349)